MTERETTPPPELEPGACEREIRSLHDFFADWYTGELGDDAFDRFEDALAPSFEMVTPDGDVLKRDDIVEYVRGKRDAHADGGFDIEIRNVETVDARSGRTLVRYEEWQTLKEETEGRISTSLFAPSDAAHEGVEWRHLHETWLDP